MFQKLSPFVTNFRVLLTGTPLQNNIMELFNLLSFIDSNYDPNTLKNDFSSLNQDTQVGKLHDLLRPHILRRLKSDVMKEMIPDKVALLVPVSLSRLQKQYYKAILTKNYPLINQVRQSSILHDPSNGQTRASSQPIASVLRVF
jgi:chromodomain-helicase-DNA-binding protein 4